MTKRQEFIKQNITTLKFSTKALEPLRKLYEILAGELEPPSVKMGLKLHEDGPNFEDVRMRWYFANSREAISLFRDVLDSCNLAFAREIVGTRKDLVRVVQANLIEIRGGYPRGTWHSDFMDDALHPGDSATILTPLYPLQTGLGGLETTTAKRQSGPFNYDDFSKAYRYQEGEAVVFDAFAMIHRTQSYRAKPSALRVLVSWQIADTRRSMRRILERIGRRNGDPMFLFPHL
jgi:hypothetical protein